MGAGGTVGAGTGGSRRGPAAGAGEPAGRVRAGRPARDRPAVLVTGASHGIGLATARLLAAHGYQVFGASRKPGREDLGGVVMLPLDVTCDESARSCVAGVLERAGRIDVLVNNAGVGLLGAAEEIPVDQARALYETNLFGTARMINAVLPQMRQRRTGLIINLGSVAGGLPTPFHGWLSSSKAAVASYSDALRLEVKPFHIAVTVVEPGMVATHQGERFTQLEAGASIGDYAGQEHKAMAVFKAGQRSGSAPELVARTILRIIGTAAPARYYLVGPQKWYARLARILPPAAVEAIISRRLRLTA